MQDALARITADVEKTAADLRELARTLPPGADRGRLLEMAEMVDVMRLEVAGFAARNVAKAQAEKAKRDAS